MASPRTLVSPDGATRRHFRLGSAHARTPRRRRLSSRRPNAAARRLAPRRRHGLRRLAPLVGLLWLWACSSEPAHEDPSGAAPLQQLLAAASLPEPAATVATLASTRSLGPSLAPRETATASDREPAAPYACERFELRVRSDGRRWHKRLRRSWGEADRQRFRRLVSMVADEMGADPRLLTLWALRESTYNPYAIHVLDPDVDASTATWRRHRWDPEQAAELEARMEALGARDRGYWQAKAELARISRFRDNPHYDDRIRYEVVEVEGERWAETTSAWGYGYGPFGFNPTYFLPVWDATAPPWVFCEHDGIAAIISAIWAARAHQRECRSLGHGDSYEVVNRRFSSGHCAPRPGRVHLFRKRARARGIRVDAKAKLGTRWAEADSDRAEVLEHMRALAEAQGLLSSYALAGEGLAPEGEAVVVSREAL